MSLLNEISDNLKKSSQKWVQWARQHAQDLGESSLRQIERQDLLAERQRIQTEIGARVVEAFLEQNQKTIRPGSPQLSQRLERVAEIEARLAQIAEEEKKAREEEKATESEQQSPATQLPNTEASDADHPPREESEGSIHDSPEPSSEQEKKE